MEFIERQVQYPEQKKITKLGVDPNNTDIVYAEIERHEGIVTIEGTPITAENLNKGNWRDDKSVSFMKRNDTLLPVAKPDETQIVTKVNGETWLIPPFGLGEPKQVAFDSTMIEEIKNAAQTAAEEAAAARLVAQQMVATGGGTILTDENAVTLANAKIGTDFPSNAQLNSLQQTVDANDTNLSGQITALQQIVDVNNENLDLHINNANNPHGVTAAQVDAPTNSQFNAHSNDSERHITSAERATWNALQAQIISLQTQINNMLNGTAVFTLLKANTIDLV